MNTYRGFAACVAAAAVLISAAPSLGKSDAHARYSKAPIYAGKPDLQTTINVVAAGGGVAEFSSSKLVGVLAGAKASAEVAALTQKFGSANVKSFYDVFDFVIDDSLKIATAAKIALPAPTSPPPDGRSLSASLYALGLTPDKTFDVEYMIDGLVTHPVHLEVMKDIDASPKFGEKADDNYHAVLTQVMDDLKAVYSL